MDLIPGIYDLEITKDGFKTRRQTAIELHTDQKLRLDILLEIGGPNDSVTVTESALPLQTQTAGTGQVIASPRIQDLPLLGRNMFDLLLLIPGVSPGAGGNVSNYSITGQREFSNSLLLNGIEVSGNRNNDTQFRPSVDAVQEFKAATSTYAAEFGRSGGGVVAIETRSGGNQFHGSLLEFLRTNATTARTFFASEKSGLKENTFGGSVGGPLLKNRTFVFGAYEGKRQRNTFSYLDTTVPKNMVKVTPAGIDLSGLRDPYTNTVVPIFDPLFYKPNYYAQQFPGNVIPAARVSAAGLQILQKLFPSPNAAGTFNGWFSNYRVSQRYAFDSDVGDLRIDHIFSQRNRLSFSYDVLRFASLTGDRFAGAIEVPGGGSVDSGDQTDSANHTLAASITSVIAADQLNKLRIGFLHTPLSQNHLIQRTIADQLGMRNISLPGYPATQGLPYIYLAFGAFTGGSTYKPLTFEDNNFSLADHYTWNRGRHIVRFGYEYRRLISNPSFSLFPTGYMYFSGAYASLTSDPNYAFDNPAAYYENGGSEIADLLLGYPGYVAMGLQFFTPRTTSSENHLFAQDSWRVNSRFTVEYGLRYEYQAPYRETNGHQANLDLAQLRLSLAGEDGNSPALVAPDKNNFAPRLGIAYRVGSRWVLRSGYGIFYTPEHGARNDVLTKNYPFFSQQTFVSSATGPISYTLDTGIPRPTSAPAISGSDVTAPPNQILYYVDPRFRTGYSQMFNFTAQGELAKDTVLEAGYIGGLSHKQPYPIADLNLAGRLSKQLGIVRALTSQGNIAYHALQIKLERRFRDHWLLAAYTLGKTLDNGPAPLNLLLNRQYPQDASNLSLERAPASTDARHTFTTAYSWNLPFGRAPFVPAACTRVCGAILQGWQLNGVLTLRSGLPANVVRNGNTIGYEGLRPNLLRDPNLPDDERTLSRYFDTKAFSVAGLGKTQPGNAGRNVVRGPGLVNWDASVFRNISLSETMNLQLRFEAFNITNTPHFANPNTDLSQGQFGSITKTTGNPRILQFAAKILF